MFQLLLLTLVFGSMSIKVQLTTLSCRTSPLSSSRSEGGKDKHLADPVHPDCEWYNLCSNESAAEVTTNYINCSSPEFVSRSIPGNCHVWGSDGSHQQMLFIYLLKITPENLILYYFNDSYGSQQYPFNLTPRQQLCTPTNNLDIGKVINESCTSRESIPTVLSNVDSQCCSDSNVKISFNGSEGTMKITFLQGSIEIPVDYLDCTRKPMATVTTLFTTNTYSSTSNTTFLPPSPSHDETLTLLVAGISTPLLMVALAVIITIVVAILWTKGRKSTKNVHNREAVEQDDGPYTTLTRQEYPDITSNHPMEVLYAVVDMPENSQGEEGQLMKQDEKNVESPPNSDETKRGVALENLYAVVDKQQKK